MKTEISSFEGSRGQYHVSKWIVSEGVYYLLTYNYSTTDKTGRTRHFSIDIGKFNKFEDAMNFIHKHDKEMKNE